MPRVYPPIDGKTTDRGLPPSIVETVAGFTAGIVSTLVVHPFDVVKTRLQVDQSTKAQVGNSLRIARDIARDEGLWTGFYRGLTPNIIGNSVSWALYFMWYGNIKDLCQKYRGVDTRLHSIDYFLASGASGVLTAFFTNPIWVIKTRMLSTSRASPGAYVSVADGARRLWRSEGIRGFYRGLLPSLFGVSHGAIQFMAYEKLKIWRMGQLASATGDGSATISTAGAGALKALSPGGAVVNVELSNWDFLTLSALSKIFAGSITYPYQVVRTRLQTHGAGTQYAGARDLIKQVWRNEGLVGFYKGLGPNIVRVLPSTCVTFLVYENTKVFFPRFFSPDEELAATGAATTTSTTD